MAGKLPELGDDQLWNRSQIAVEQVQKPLCQQTQQVGRGTSVRGQVGFGRFDVRQYRLPNDSAEQVFLGREIQVDRALADPGGGSDILELGRRITAFGERGEGGGDDLAGTCVFATGAGHSA